MAGGHRYDMTAAAGDPLPTLETIALAKGHAARACCERVAEAVWASRAHAHTWVDRIPVLAHAVLVRLCPEVSAARLARCLGLDPVEACERLRTVCRPDLVSEALIDATAQDVLRGA